MFGSSSIPLAEAAPPTPASQLRRLVVNLGWLGAQKLAVILIGIVATGVVARHLGPEKAGVLAGAQALAVVFGIAALGVDPTVFTRHLNRQPERQASIMGGTTCVLASIGLLSWMALIVYLVWIDEGPVMLRTTAAIIGFRMCIVFPAPVAMWFQSRLETREVVLPNTAGTLVFRGWQVLSSLLGWGVLRIAWAEILSLITIAFFSFRFYLRKGGSVRAWRADWRCGWRILAESLPALLATCLISLMSRVDVIMLRAMAGEVEVGFFSAASSITESVMFFSGMLVTVFSPVLVKSFHANQEVYECQRLAYARITACCGWILAAAVSAASGMIIAVVFGKAYEASAPVLAVHGFLLLPAMLGASTQCQLTIERRLRWLALILAVALALDVILNAALIPAFGAVGAAAASVIAAALAYTLAPALVPATRSTGIAALRALLFPFPRRGDVQAFARAA